MTAFHITYHFIINFIKFQLQQRQDNASFYTHRYFATSRTRSVQKCWEMCTVMTVTWNLSAGLGVNNTSPSLVTPLSPSLWSAKPSLPPTGLKRFVVDMFQVLSLSNRLSTVFYYFVPSRTARGRGSTPFWILHLVEYLSCLEVQY